MRKELNWRYLQLKSDISDSLPIIFNWVIKLKAQMILELGVRSGESTKAFLQALAYTGGKMTSMDIDDCSRVSVAPNWKFVQGDDLKLEFREQVDILFIDTNHTYTQTLLELIRYAPSVTEDGVILLHDVYNHVQGTQVRSAMLDFIAWYDQGWSIQLVKGGEGLGIMKRV